MPISQQTRAEIDLEYKHRRNLENLVKKLKERLSMKYSNMRIVPYHTLFFGTPGRSDEGDINECDAGYIIAEGGITDKLCVWLTGETFGYSKDIRKGQVEQRKGFYNGFTSLPLVKKKLYEACLIGFDKLHEGEETVDTGLPIIAARDSIFARENPTLYLFRDDEKLVAACRDLGISDEHISLYFLQD